MPQLHKQFYALINEEQTVYTYSQLHIFSTFSTYTLRYVYCKVTDNLETMLQI